MAASVRMTQASEKPTSRKNQSRSAHSVEGADLYDTLASDEIFTSKSPGLVSVASWLNGKLRLQAKTESLLSPRRS